MSVTRASPRAHLPVSKAVRPDYRDLHAPVVPDVLSRRDRTLHAVFRRVQAGDQPGDPRFKGSTRYHRCTDKQCGTGACLDKGLLVRSTIGRVAVRWSRRMQGTAKTGTIERDAAGW